MKKKKKKISWSIKILLISGTILIIFTSVVLFLMAVFSIPEPTTLILSFFSAFAATQIGNVYLNGIKQKSEAKINELDITAMPCERTLAEMQETYLGGTENELDNG